MGVSPPLPIVNNVQPLIDESFLLFGRASGVERLLEALTLLL
jgi:hypothetical protein